MKHLWRIVPIACAFVVMLCLPTVGRAQVSLQSEVFGSGGSPATDGTYMMVGTAGQPVIGPVGDDIGILWQGFWYTLSNEEIAGVHEEYADNGAGSEVVLNQNVPNPFHSTTEVRINLPASGHVSLKLYDAVGNEARTLIDGEREAGTIVVTVSAKDLESGQYLARLTSGGIVRTIRMMVVK
ncbi:MAG: T9SS type A sorting domain-containing protein [Candidatus Kapaibacterium sp.]